jgi:hypothetical protein
MTFMGLQAATFVAGAASSAEAVFVHVIKEIAPKTIPAHAVIREFISIPYRKASDRLT